MPAVALIHVGTVKESRDVKAVSLANSEGPVAGLAQDHAETV